MKLRYKLNQKIENILQTCPHCSCPLFKKTTTHEKKPVLTLEFAIGEGEFKILALR